MVSRHALLFTRFCVPRFIWSFLSVRSSLCPAPSSCPAPLSFPLLLPSPPTFSLACCCRPVCPFLPQPSSHISFGSGFGFAFFLCFCFCGRASCVEISSFALSFIVSSRMKGCPLSVAVPVVLFPPSPLLLEWDWSACLLCCSHVVYPSRLIVDLWLCPDLTSSAPIVFVFAVAVVCPARYRHGQGRRDTVIFRMRSP